MKFELWMLAFLLVLSACSRNDSLRWTEDVKLPDGRIVTVDRYQEFKGPHELRDTPTESDYWFEFKHSDTGEKVRWESDRDLATLALMVDGKTPVLLVTPRFGRFDRRRCPDPPYLLFRYERRAWREVDIATIPVKRLRPNMTYSPKNSRDMILAEGRRLSEFRSMESGAKFTPYTIDFTNAPAQQFGQRCWPPFNRLEDKTGARP